MDNLVFPGIWRSMPIILLICVIAVCIYVNVGVDAKQEALAAVEVVPSIDRLDFQEEADHSILTPPTAEPVDRYVPGNLLSDLREALDYGEYSDLLRTTRNDEHRLLKRWGQEIQSEESRGVTVFWLGTDSDGVRTGKLSVTGSKPKGLIKMQKIDSRWMVVGAEELPEE